MKWIIAALALLVTTSASASWIYNWEGTCGGHMAFGCSTAEATFTLPDAYHPGASFSCYAWEPCIEFVYTTWTINYPDKPSIVTSLQGTQEHWGWWWNPAMVLPTGPQGGFASMCWHGCGDVGIQIGVDITGGITWVLFDGYHWVSGLDYRWDSPKHVVAEPRVLALLLLGFVALWRTHRA